MSDEWKHLYGIARESLRARILTFMEANNLKPKQVRVVIPRLWLEGVEVETGDVEGVVIEHRKPTRKIIGSFSAGTQPFDRK